MIWTLTEKDCLIYPAGKNLCFLSFSLNTKAELQISNSKDLKGI